MRDALEQRLRSGEMDDSPAFAGHVAKYRSLMPSLALLFYLVDVVADPEAQGTGGVPVGAARLAAAWCEYLEHHARKLYAAELAPGVPAAHALAQKIESGAIINGCKVRDIYRHHWAGLQTPSAVRAALDVLEDAGWVHVEEVVSDGRPSEVIRLHPDLRGEQHG